MTSEMVSIGKITSPFGVQGKVKVYPYSDFLERCYLLKRVKLEGEAVDEFRDVKEAYLHKNLWVIHFEKSDSREDAILLKGSLVKIPFDERISLPQGSYYFDEIIGLSAFSVEGEKLGTVDDILKTGNNDIYVVKGFDKEGGQREILVPALKVFVKEISVPEGYMILDLPPGLYDEGEI